MPAYVDLTGQCFGKLLVLRRGTDTVSASGKTRTKVWWCQCSCSRIEAFADHQLPRSPGRAKRNDVVDSCSECRHRRVCAVCGAGFISAKLNRCCSDECGLLHRRAKEANNYQRTLSRNSSANKDAYAARRIRAAADPAYAEHLKQQRNKNKAERLLNNPELIVKAREQARNRYHADIELSRAKQMAALEARIAAFTPKEYEAWSQERRDYARLLSERLRSTPEGRARYRHNTQE